MSNRVSIRGLPLIVCSFLSLTCVCAHLTEAEAAHEAGLHAVLVDRPGNAALSAQDKSRFAVIDSLTQLS